MQFRVPKYLERESTIAFGLTFKSLAVLAGLGLVLFFLYYVIPKIVFFFMVFLTAGLFVVFSFLKIEGQKVFELLTTSFSFIVSHRTYLWQKKEGLTPIKIVKKRQKGEEKEKEAPLRLAPKSKLGEIRSKIDVGSI